MGAKMINVYEILEDGVVVNRVLADSEFMQQNYTNYRLAEDNNAFIAANARKDRDKILADVVDPLVSNPLRWADLTAEKQAEWAAYRRALLDVPQQEGFPADTTWPTQPE
jgi:hypothetical protein